MQSEQLYNMEIVSQAPTRISFAGGATDISPYPEMYGGAVVSTTISIFMSVRLRLRRDKQVIINSNTRVQPMTYPDVAQLEYDGKLDFVKAAAKALYRRSEGFELYLYSPLPMHSGLGGSASMCVALLDAFNHLQDKKLNSYELAEVAYDLETRELHNSSGRQDQYAAAFGGFNHFEFLGHSHVRVNRLELPRACERCLNQALTLFRLGTRGASGGIIEDQADCIKKGGPILEALKLSKDMVPDMCQALVEGDVVRIGGLLDHLWQEKKRFSKLITNSQIDDTFAKLRQAGMLGGKLTGAGGGGHLLACCEIDRRDDVLAMAEQLGLVPVSLTFVRDGVMTWQSVLRTIETSNGAAGTAGVNP